MKQRKIFALALVLALLLALTGCDSADYKEAQKLYEAGSYQEAEAIFRGLEDYKDSAEMVKACQYGQAKRLFEEEAYEEAAAIFESLGDYQDSTEQAKASRYQQALALWEAGEHLDAAARFEDLGSYEDSAQQAIACKLELAENLLDEGEYQEALVLLEELEAAGGLEDTYNLLGWCRVAAYLEENHSYKKDMDPYVVTVKMDGDAIRIEANADNLTVYTWTVWREEPLAKVTGSFYIAYGKAKMAEEAEADYDMRDYQKGGTIDWDPHAHSGTNYAGAWISWNCYLSSGTVEKSLLQINGALEQMNIGVSLNALGFTNY